MISLIHKMHNRRNPSCFEGKLTLMKKKPSFFGRVEKDVTKIQVVETENHPTTDEKPI